MVAGSSRLLLAALAGALLRIPAARAGEGVIIRVQTATQVRPEAAPEPPPAPAATPKQPEAPPSSATGPAEPLEPLEPLPPAAAPPAATSGRLVHGGLLLSAISVARPLAIEAFVRVPFAGAGFGYSSFPSLLSATLLALAGANKGATTVSLERFDGWTGDARLFPFGGAFFFGAAVGRQHLAGSLTRSTDLGPERVHVDLISWFASPRLGWLFRADSGFTLGATLGLQLTLSSDQRVEVPPEASATLKKNLDNLVHFAAGLPLPEVLLRAGYLF